MRPDQDRQQRTAHDDENRVPAEVVSSTPPISGAIIGATTIAMVTQPIIEAGAVAIIKVADYCAADHNADGRAERLDGTRDNRGP